MADHPQQQQQQPAAQGIFSRRPSFFGGKNKGHRHTQSTFAHAHTPSNPPPPTLNLQPAANSGLKTPPLEPDQYHFPAKLPTTPQKRRHASRHSIASSVTDLGSQLRRSRSASLRTNTSDGTAKTSSSSHRRTPSATLALAHSPEKAPVPPGASHTPRPALSISTFSRNKQKSSENVRSDGQVQQQQQQQEQQAQVYEKSPLCAVDKPKTPFNMAVPMPLRHPPSQKEILQANQQSNRTLAPAAPIPVPNGTNPNTIFQHIHELASKRISTLDYLRKA